MFVDLRRKLNEVALNACCTIVVSVAHERVECVSELMEHSVDIVDGLECRLIGRSNCHVADIDYERDLAFLYSLCVLLILLSAEACTPCTGTLAIAWEIVAEEDSEFLAVLVDDTPALCCWLVRRHLVSDLLECKTIELVGNIEDALEHIVDLKIFAHFLFVDVVLCLLCAIRIIHVVPTFWLEVETVLLDLCLDVGNLFLSLGNGWSPDLVEQVIDVLAGLCHTVFECYLRVVAIAHKLSLLNAESYNLTADITVVIFVALCTTSVVSVVDLLAKVAVAAILENWIARWTLHVEHVLALLALRCSHGSSCLDVCLWKSGKLLYVIDSYISLVGLMKEVL